MRRVYRRRVLHVFLSTVLFALPAANPAGASDSSSKENGASKGKSAGDEEVVPLTRDVTPPRLVHQVQPRHVPGSRGLRVVGSVVLEFIVGSDGATRNVRVIRSLDKDVDQSAVEAIEQWRFEPARKAGKSVAVKMSAEIRFNDM
jgi:protein TonB